MGYESRENAIKNALLRELKDASGLFERDRLNLLASLISDGIMDIKIALTENEGKLGMYHEKMGIISDKEGNTVAFSGSMNETLTAMSFNYESIDVFCSWKKDNNRVTAKEVAFESIWNNCEPHIQIIDFPELKQAIIDKYKRKAPNYDIDIQEYSTLISKTNLPKTFWRNNSRKLIAL